MDFKRFDNGAGEWENMKSYMPTHRGLIIMI